jgi:hypothetical protein
VEGDQTRERREVADLRAGAIDLAEGEEAREGCKVTD